MPPQQNNYLGDKGRQMSVGEAIAFLRKGRGVMKIRLLILVLLVIAFVVSYHRNAEAVGIGCARTDGGCQDTGCAEQFGGLCSLTRPGGQCFCDF